MSRKGFTLTELLLVIAIIVLLIAITFPVMSAVRAKAARTACMAHLQSIGQSIIMYYDDEGFLPGAGDLQKAIDNGLLQACEYDPQSYVENWDPEIGGNRYPGETSHVPVSGAFPPKPAEAAPNIAEVVCTYCQHGHYKIVLYLDGRVAVEKQPSRGGERSG